MNIHMGSGVNVIYWLSLYSILNWWWCLPVLTVSRNGINSLDPGKCGCNIWLYDFETLFSDWCLEYFLWNCPRVIATGPPWWRVNIALGNGWLPSDLDLWSHMVSLGHNELNFYIWNCLRKHKSIIVFSIISHYRVGPGDWNLSSWKSRSCLFCILNIMAADDLTTLGPKHQQPWYWPSYPGIFWFQLQGFIYWWLCLPVFSACRHDTLVPRFDSKVCVVSWLIYCNRADTRFPPSQWEMALQSNAISHWLGANLESALL